MKNLIAFLLSCLSLSGVVAQVVNETQVRVVSKSATETVLTLTLTGADKHAVGTPQGEAYTISIPQGTPMLQLGKPDVPKFATTLMIPATGNMAIEVQAAEYNDYPNVEIAPSKGDLKRNVNPDSIPYKYGEVYEQDAFFPGQLADLKQPFVMRDVRGQALWIYPVQYNPVQKTLRVYSKITLRVHYKGGQGENELLFAPTRGASPTFEQVYRKLFLNYEERTQGRGGFAEPEKMLVIAKDELLPELEPLLVWKRQMGIHTIVMPLSEIGSSEAAAIYNVTKNHYENEGITYLLLVGDENAIKSQMRPSGGTLYTCDNCFGYMEGDDHFVEILVGRLHARNLEDMKIMVNRNLNYEKTPLVDVDANWCATGMASCSNEGAGFGDDGQADWEHGNEWKIKHLASGYEKYWEFYDGSQGSFSPTPGDETADKPGNPVNTSLVSLMNGRGVSLYNYTGHGWEQGLVSGNFNNDAVAMLRNTHRYPVLIAVACCAGNFTNGECLGEVWQRAGDPATGEAWGGIAGFFSSDFQSWSPPMEGQDGMNQYLVDADGITLRPSICGMLAYGNALMIAAYGNGGEVMADFWNPFAEPSTMPRTKLPQVLAASHQPAAFVGASNLAVYSPVEGALASLYWQGQTLAVATVENGVANLSFPALNNVGDLTLTLTQFNYIPYQSTLTVTPASGAFVVNQAVVLDDAAGNNNQLADYGETIKMNVKLANLGVEVAQSASATLSVADANVVILDGSESFGDIGPDASVEKLAAFSFKVNDFVNDGQVVTFTMQVKFNDTAVFETVVPVKLHAPKLSIGSIKIDDTQGGNGDGYLQSGETATIIITNLNTGNSVSPNALGFLSTNSPWLVVNGTASVGPIAAVNGSSAASFQVSVLNDAPKVIPAHFQYQLEAGNYGKEATFGAFIINPILETFESSNFNTYNWVMSGNKPWVISSANPYSGLYSARSGIISHNQKSVMELSLKVSEDGNISFARRTHCEQEFDFLRFSIDGVEMGRWSGLLPWEEVSFPVSPGYHTFTWSYEKDGFVSEGQDRVWVDEILLPPNEIIVSTDPTAPQRGFELSVQPNPTAGPAMLNIHLAREQFITVEVFDYLGRRVRSEQSETRFPMGGFMRPLDLSGLASGVYMVQVRTENESKVVKVAKE